MRFRAKRAFDMPAPVVGLVGMLLGLTQVGLAFEIRASPSRSFGLTVVTQQGSGGVACEAYENVGKFWTKPGAARTISKLLVSTRGHQVGATVLRQIETETPQRGPVIYGNPPEGFVQMVPGTGAAPALRPDEEYAVSVLGPGRAGRGRFSLRTSPPIDR